jgi:hypothetical protein
MSHNLHTTRTPTMRHTILHIPSLAAALSLVLGAACARPAMAQDVGELNQEKVEEGRPWANYPQK